MEFLEFYTEINEDDDAVYVFKPLGPTATGEFKAHTTKITVNGLGEDMEGYCPIVTTECSCKAKEIYKKDCKHLIECIKILNNRGVKVKHEETDTTDKE